MKIISRLTLIAAAAILGGFMLAAPVAEAETIQKKAKSAKAPKKKAKHKGKKADKKKKVKAAKKKKNTVSKGITADELLARGDIKNPTPEMRQKADEALAALGIKPKKRIDSLIEACNGGDLELIYNLIVAGTNTKERKFFRPMLVAAGKGDLEQLKLWHAAGQDVNDPHPITDERALWCATKNGNINCVKFLLTCGADKTRGVDTEEERGKTPFHLASIKGDLPLLKLLLPEGDAINRKAAGATALYNAAKRGHADCVKYLLDAGADPNTYASAAFGLAKVYALEAAVTGGHNECVQLLLAAPGIDTSFFTPLQMEAIKDNHKKVEQLLKGAVDDETKKKAFMTAACMDSCKALRVFIKSGAPGGDSAFTSAIHNGKIDSVKLFLEEGFKDHESMKNGDAIDYAARGGQPKMCQLLIDAGADISKAAPISNYDSEDEKVSAEVFEEFVKLSIKSGGNLNAAERYGCPGRPALHAAIGRKYTSSVRLLIEAGADVNAVSEAGYTPLQDADAECTELLIKAKADIEKADSQGGTPLASAARWGDKEKVALLIKAGAEVNTTDNDGWTPLSWAAWFGYEEIAEQLIKAGADVNKKDKNGEGPIQKAKSRGHNDIVPLLEAAAS